ncbi:MAG TPA: hypothetical protein VFV82_07320 [Candidatus Binatia bacterium]|nr:hypothetical protein [Candidatus Binatia bacterium]
MASKQEHEQERTASRDHRYHNGDADKAVQDRVSKFNQTLTRMQREASGDQQKSAEFEQLLDDLQSRVDGGPTVMAGRAEEIQINPSSPAGNRNP